MSSLSREKGQTAQERETEKQFAYKTLDRILHNSRGGFYFLIASPQTQAAALAQHKDANLAVYDFAKAKDQGMERHIIQILWLTQREPDRDVYVYQNFQLALWDNGLRNGAGDWDVDAIHRLNYSRDQLNELRKRMVFCMTPEADNQLNRHAMDFYDFVQIFLRLEDEPEERPERPIALRPVDRSVGVDVKVDWSQNEEPLLIQAIALGNQARELYRQARYTDALVLCEKELSIRISVLGPRDKDVALSYNNIGMIYDAMGNYTKALDYLKKALSVGENIPGLNAATIAPFYNNIGNVYNDIGQYSIALKYHHKALDIRLSTLGQRNPLVSESYNNIGNTYYRIGQYTKALDYYKTALRSLEATLGKNHLLTAVTYDNIGKVLNQIKAYAEAIEYHKRALSTRESALGLNHRNTAQSYGNLGNVYYNMGDYPRALEYYQKALAVYEKILGVQHPYTIDAYNNIALSYERMGDTTTAAEWRKKARDARQKRDTDTNQDKE